MVALERVDMRLRERHRSAIKCICNADGRSDVSIHQDHVHTVALPPASACGGAWIPCRVHMSQSVRTAIQHEAGTHACNKPMSLSTPVSTLATEATALAIRACGPTAGAGAAPRALLHDGQAYKARRLAERMMLLAWAFKRSAALQRSSSHEIALQKPVEYQTSRRGELTDSRKVEQVRFASNAYGTTGPLLSFDVSLVGPDRVDLESCYDQGQDRLAPHCRARLSSTRMLGCRLHAWQAKRSQDPGVHTT
jgi:hypothetical protein